jgi:hypothetical protein
MNKNWLNLSLLLIFLTVLPGACAPATKPAAEEATSDGDETSSRAEVASAVLIYERSGGLRGIGPGVQEWRLYGDGRIEGSDGNSWQAEPEAVQELVGSILDTSFTSLEPSYIPEDTCCDRATHRITIQTGEDTYTVETLDGANMPESLSENLEAINLFLMDLYE